MASIGDIVAHLKLDISDFANKMDVAMNEIDNSAEKFGGIKRAGEALAPVGKLLTATVTAPVAALGAVFTAKCVGNSVKALFNAYKAEKIYNKIECLGKDY